jgi:TRAP-type C4-dicarboxylate transport system permease large subunit
MAPSVSHLFEPGLIEARAYHQKECFEAAMGFARSEGHILAPETSHAVKAANVLLLAVGALMDIFSAIVIVVPLIVPLAEAYGVGFAHLGIIFLANLELGYLTPPVGLNLFLSALTFDKPLLKVWRAALPFLAIFAVWVALVTYVPFLSEGVVDLVLRILGG